MALAHVHYWSPALQKQCGMFITLPDGDVGRLPVVWQLHGLSDDYTIWQRRTSIERYAERYRVLVAMPDGGRAFYCDSPLGRWEQHILDSVAFVERTFPVIAAREGRAIGGLSMGGYGAMKIGLKHPDVFCSIAAHSGVIDVGERAALSDVAEKRAIFGRGVPSGDDCFALARTHARRRGPKPALRIDCGSEDFLIEHNRRFHAHLAKLKVAHEYEEHPGAHNWDYWDLHVDAALRFHRRQFDALARPAARRRK